MSTVAFKIRRKSDGLFAGGGYYAHFHKHGKAWSTEAALRAHLTLVSHQYGSTREAQIKRAYEGCEVVRFEQVASRVEDVLEFDARREPPKRGRR